MTDDPTPTDDRADPDEPVIRCEVVSPGLEELRAFLSEMGEDVDLGCRPVARRQEQGYSMQILAPRSRIDAARASRSAADVTLTEIEDATEAARERQAEVSRGNRFEQRGDVPRGLGVKE